MNSRWAYPDAAEDDKLKKGPWTDIRLLRCVRIYGDRRWSALAKAAAGLRRCGKSCRLRWVNYLHPDLKRGNITEEEERVIIDLHARWGNRILLLLLIPPWLCIIYIPFPRGRWSLIASQVPGRTDNQIKNYWRSRLRRKELQRRPENNYTTRPCQRAACGYSSPEHFPLALSDMPSEQQTSETVVEHPLYSTVHPYSREAEKTHTDHGDAMTLKLDISPASSSLLREFMANAGTDISSIISKGTNTNKSPYMDELQEQVGQVLSTQPTGYDPQMNGFQNDQGMGRIDPPLSYGSPPLEADELSAILRQFHSGIPAELEDILAATALHNSEQACPVVPCQRACEADLCLDFTSADIRLWNTCPFP